VGEWESGRMGEWENGREGEWERGREGERVKSKESPHGRGRGGLISKYQYLILCSKSKT
jgi:hypothetical protein